MDLFGHIQEIAIGAILLLVFAFEIAMFAHVLGNKHISSATKFSGVSGCCSYILLWHSTIFITQVSIVGYYTVSA